MPIVAMIFVFASLFSGCGDGKKQAAASQGKWLSNMSEAKQAAKQLKRPILVYISNLALPETKNPEFVSFAEKNLVLVYMNLSEKEKWTDAEKNANQPFLDDYGIVDKGELTIVTTSDGSIPLSMLSGNPNSYQIKQLELAVKTGGESVQDQLTKPASRDELNRLFDFMPEVLAEINGKKVTKEQFVTDFMKEGYPMVILNGFEKSQLYKEIRSYADVMIERAVIEQLAENAGYKKSPELVKRILTKAREEMSEEDRKISDDNLKKNDETFESYLEKVSKEDECQQAALVQAFLQEKYVAQIEEKITDADVLKFYESHKKDLTTPENVTVAHILIQIPEEATQEQKDAAKKKIDAIYETLQKSPDKFDELAETQSDCPTGKRSKGKLPPFGRDGSMIQVRGTTDKTFTDESFKLEKIGEISKPFQTRFGWHVVKLLEKKEEFTRGMDDNLKKSLRQELSFNQANEALSKDIKDYQGTEQVKLYDFAPQK